MKEKLLELGQGLELWKVGVDELREQDTNARSMPKEMFQRLTETIGRDKRLESLPFCALTPKGVEIVSGHHRVRTARAAEVKDIYILVDVTGLTPSEIAAKQLAHNSIEGTDNEQLVREIYAKIEDAASKPS
jgi:ParB-like chromosome segregation protein Spo0J